MNAKLLGLFLALVLLASMYSESEGFASSRVGRKRSSIQVSRETSWNTWSSTFSHKRDWDFYLFVTRDLKTINVIQWMQFFTIT